MDTIQAYKDYIYGLIKTNMLPERYKSDPDMDIYIRLLSEVFGSFLYHKDRIPDLTNADKCDPQFLPYLASNLGYDPPDSISEDNLRLLIKKFLEIRRRRGTIESIKNAVRYAGRDELSLLGNLSDTTVSFDEVETEGIYLIEASNVDIDQIEDMIQSVRPAGTKWTYALRYSVPIVRSTPEGVISPSWGAHIIIGSGGADLKTDSLIIPLSESSDTKTTLSTSSQILVGLGENTDLRSSAGPLASDDMTVVLNEVVTSLNLLASSDSLDTNLVERSSTGGNPSVAGVALYGSTVYGKSR